MKPFLRVLLAGSLLLNLLFLGFGGALAWHLRHGAAGLAEHSLTRTLGPADQRIMRQQFAAAAPQAAAAQAQMRAAHAAVDAALRTEPFDPAALQTALDGWRMATEQYLTSFEAPMLRGAEAISPAGRRAMADLGDRQIRHAARLYGP